MIKRIAEDIVYLLIKKKYLDINKYEIYVYGMEIILLNGSILAACLAISIALKMIIHFVAFLIFFIPGRMLSGGYHCKNSEACFIFSIIVYLMSVFIVNSISTDTMQHVTEILTIILTAIVWKYAPHNSKRHNLEPEQYIRNKKMLHVVILLDFVLLVTFSFLELNIRFSGEVFMMFVAISFVIEFAKKSNN